MSSRGVDPQHIEKAQLNALVPQMRSPLLGSHDSIIPLGQSLDINRLFASFLLVKFTLVYQFADPLSQMRNFILCT